jgi:hypothetical protein
MKKEELKSLVENYGDAVITYRSKESNKLKYNVCTIDFNNRYIQNKRNRAQESEDNVLLFCWDTDSYRLLNPEQVTSVVPLSSVLKNEE